MNNPTIKYANYKDDCIKFLQRLVKIPSVNGRDNEEAVVNLIAEESKRLDLPYKIYAKDLMRPNIFVGEDFSSDQNLLLVAHMDTVPEGDLNSWNHNPFAADIEDNKLFGRGAFDCKGGIAISLYALKILKDINQLNKVKFVGVSDEESGADSVLGLRYVLEQGLKAKGAVYTYGNSDHNFLTIGHRGVIRLWVTCKGESTHAGSKSWQDKTKGENAIDGIVEFLKKAKDFKVPGENKYFPGYSFALTSTMIHGGTGESIVPDECQVLLDIRTLPEHKENKIIDAIKDITDKLSKGKRTFKVEVKNNVQGALTNPESWIVQEALKLNQEIFGIDSQLTGSGPANEGYMLINRDIPTITGYGPLGGNFHSPNEFADLTSIEQSLQFLVELAFRINDK